VYFGVIISKAGNTAPNAALGGVSGNHFKCAKIIAHLAIGCLKMAYRVKAPTDASGIKGLAEPF